MSDIRVSNIDVYRQSAMDVGPLGPVLATARWDGDAWRVVAADGGFVGILRDADGNYLAADQYAAACDRLRELLQLAELDVDDIVVVDEHTIRAYGPERCQVEPFAAPHRYNPVREVGDDWEVCGRPVGDPIHDVETAAAEAAAETYADGYGRAAARAEYDRALAAAEPIRPTAEQRQDAAEIVAARRRAGLPIEEYVVGYVTPLIRRLAEHREVSECEIARVVAMLDAVEGVGGESR